MEHACEQRKHAHVHDLHSLLPHLHMAFRRLCSFHTMLNLYSESWWTLKHCGSTKFGAHVSYQQFYNWVSRALTTSIGLYFFFQPELWTQKESSGFLRNTSKQESYHILSYCHYFHILANHLWWKSWFKGKGKDRATCSSLFVQFFLPHE